MHLTAAMPLLAISTWSSKTSELPMLICSHTFKYFIDNGLVSSTGLIIKEVVHIVEIHF